MYLFVVFTWKSRVLICIPEILVENDHTLCISNEAMIVWKNDSS